jgi:phytanoyl-CoA hydroxylase
MLTIEQKKSWDEQGYLILSGFFGDRDIEELARFQRQIWHQCPPDVVVDDIETGRRCYMNSLSLEERQHNLKVNDLYLRYPEIRRYSLQRNLVQILTELLQDRPVLCNTLNMRYGSEQFLHRDTLYMTPKSDDRLVATWIALEDVHPDAGPLRYIPGSHKIPIYRFSNGSQHIEDSEWHLWQAYMQQKVAEFQLKEAVFLGKKGDVFIWNAHLLHGGSPIRNQTLTRNSLVSHYFGKSDCLSLGSLLVPDRGGYWMRRPPLPVQGEPFVRTKLEHQIRITLHHFRLWKRDVGNVFGQISDLTQFHWQNWKVEFKDVPKSRR